MSDIRADGYKLYDPDADDFVAGINNEAYQILVGDVKRIKQQLAGLGGTTNPAGVGQPTAAITSAQVSAMISAACYPYGFSATLPIASGTFNAGTSATITYPAASWNTTAGAWDNTTFVAPSLGLYQILGVALFFYGATATPDCTLSIVKNGVTVLTNANQQLTLAGVAPLLTDTVCITSLLAAGDRVTSSYINNAGIGGALRSDLTILRLGANP